MSRHTYGPWRDRKTELNSIGKLCVLEGETHSTCTRCKVWVKKTASGAVKFWVGGTWMSKHPCRTV